MNNLNSSFAYANIYICAEKRPNCYTFFRIIALFAITTLQHGGTSLPGVLSPLLLTVPFPVQVT